MNFELLMRRAIELATLGKGTTHPNPLVGALIVDDTGKILAEGYHKKQGENHAEVNALKELLSKNISATGKTMIVTLEPCNHHGNTPPCTEAILDADIKRVVIGATDTNPNIKGKGSQKLREAGVDVITGILEHDCRKQNRAYFSRIERIRPWIIAKWAMSIDGKIATKTGDSSWITCDESRKLARELRAYAGSVLVGAGTILKDDPMLNYRGERNLNQPLRIILDPNAKIHENHKIFHVNGGGKILRIRTQTANMFTESDKDYRITPANVENIENKAIFDIIISDTLSIEKKLPLLKISEILSTEFDISAVLVEGGSKTLTAFFDAGLIDEVNVFISPKIIGGKDALTPISGKGISDMCDITKIEEVEYKIISNQDVFLSGFLSSDFFAQR